MKRKKWEFYNDGTLVDNSLVDKSQAEGCVQFAYEKGNGRVSVISNLLRNIIFYKLLENPRRENLRKS